MWPGQAARPGDSASPGRLVGETSGGGRRGGCVGNMGAGDRLC